MKVHISFWSVMFKDYSNPITPLVREFYAKFYNQNEHSVKTIVEGVLILLILALLGKILGLSLLNNISSRMLYETKDDYNLDEVMQFYW